METKHVGWTSVNVGDVVVEGSKLVGVVEKTDVRTSVNVVVLHTGEVRRVYRGTSIQVLDTERAPVTTPANSTILCGVVLPNSNAVMLEYLEYFEANGVTVLAMHPEGLQHHRYRLQGPKAPIATWLDSHPEVLDSASHWGVPVDS